MESSFTILAQALQVCTLSKNITMHITVRERERERGGGQRQRDSSMYITYTRFTIASCV